MTQKKPPRSPKSPKSDTGTHLLPRKYSVRLPLRLASRIEALREMHPHKTRPELMRDLLELGLAEVDRAATHSTGTMTGFHPDTSQPIYLLTGPFSEFHGLVYKHHLAMEHELAKDEPELSYPVDEYALGEVE